MYTEVFRPEIWTELLWNFLWVLMIPVAVTMILLTITIIAEVVSSATNERRRRNKVYSHEPSRSRELEA